MPDPATNTSAGVTAGLWILGAAGGVVISPVDFVSDTGIAMAGAVSYQFLKAQMAREKAAEAGAPPESRPRVDLVTLGYAMAGAVVSTGFLLYLTQVVGGVKDLYSIGGFYAAGAFGPQFAGLILNLFSKVLGAFSAGAKP